MVVTSIPPQDRAPSIQQYELSRKLPIEKALGVNWCVESDTLGFRINLQDNPMTRRGTLATISSIYDVFGFASPFLLRGRKILQEITSDNHSWDDPVSDEHRAKWSEWRSSLPLLNKINIRRCYKTEHFGESVDSTLHCFSDASFYGYGQVSYLRQVSRDGKIEVALVMAKSRVSPLKPVTIPRLELTAALLSTKVGTTANRELEFKNLRNTYWTDSMVSLGYILNDTRRFKIYVANRAKKIREASKKEQWMYIATKANPVDDTTKRISLDDEEKVNKWFRGPEFLYQPEQLWKNEQVTPINEDDPELKPTLKANTIRLDSAIPTILDALEERISDWGRWKRVIAMVVKFLNICQKKDVCPILTTQEIQDAELSLVRMIQAKYLSKEILRIKEQKVVGSKPMARLNPFIDSNGILRVGGRLGNCRLSKLRHPSILPKKGIATERIILWHHKKVKHLGRTTTTNELRANGCWVLSVIPEVAKLLKDCFRCRLYRGKPGEQLMGELPTNRT